MTMSARVFRAAGLSCLRQKGLGFLPRTILLLGMSVCMVRRVERHFSGAKPPSVSVSATVAQSLLWKGSVIMDVNT